jgi:hypothetical protein
VTARQSHCKCHCEWWNWPERLLLIKHRAEHGHLHAAWQEHSKFRPRKACADAPPVPHLWLERGCAPRALGARRRAADPLGQLRSASAVRNGYWVLDTGYGKTGVERAAAKRTHQVVSVLDSILAQSTLRGFQIRKCIHLRRRKSLRQAAKAFNQRVRRMQAHCTNRGSTRGFWSAPASGSCEDTKPQHFLSSNTTQPGI